MTTDKYQDFMLDNPVPPAPLPLAVIDAESQRRTVRLHEARRQTCVSGGLLLVATATSAASLSVIGQTMELASRYQHIGPLKIVGVAVCGLLASSALPAAIGLAVATARGGRYVKETRQELARLESKRTALISGSTPSV
jgi:adenine/guanine phosphoribosyltransferase-like PRPP-binding protein